MVPLNDPTLQRIVGSLRKCDLKFTVAKLGGLLTAPELQGNTVRLETLVHLAVAHCQGSRNPGLSEISRWLNKGLLRTGIAHLEDPVDDVFITNVRTAEGNRRVFEGIWNSNSYFVQIVIDILSDSRVPVECRKALAPVFALLTLSDCVAERVGLQRWHFEPSLPGGTVKLPSTTRIARRARAVTFTANDLGVLGINRNLLAPFIFREEDKHALASETTGHSCLERHPLVNFGGDLVLTLPSAVSPAIRGFILTELQRMGRLQAFSTALATHQTRQVEEEGIREIIARAEILKPPAPNRNIPSLHDWLFKHDVDKYLHVVLLHDRMDWLDVQGLSSFMTYPDELWAGLEKYLSQAACYCRSLPSFTEGMTLVVLGGLGRGFALPIENRSDKSSLSFIGISNLLMLADELPAGEVDHPLTSYLKCIKQKEWLEGKGIYLRGVNGDYNLYCYWRGQNYQLVPREFQLTPGSKVTIANAWSLPVRAEVRSRVDCHSYVFRQQTDSYLYSGQTASQWTLFRIHAGSTDLCESGSSGPRHTGRRSRDAAWP